MKLWLLTQVHNKGYDTFDSCVVAAETLDEAQVIQPSGYPIDESDDDFWRYSSWAKPQYVSVRLLGEAHPSITEPGVICASFNAG